LILPDVNILVYAFRSGSPDHAKYRAWLSAMATSDSAYAVSVQVLCSFTRIVTNRQIFADPSNLEEALGFARDLMSRPNCRIVEPGPEHWRIFTDLCRKTRATGNLVQDAWWAALAIESGSEWVTRDRDFARFPGLKWSTPF
jgi:toxin-antitoxin system PIN domain toxin